jgi:hypothetical protein
VDPVPAIIAVAMLLLLGLLMRWVFTPSHPRRGRPVNATDARELGLLSVVSTVARADAAGAQTRLGAAGIRCSVSRRDDGRVDLLVFTGDYEKARGVLANP